MITPTISYASTQTRNPIEETRPSVPSSLDVSETSVVNREASNAFVPVQLVSVSAIGEGVAPTEQADAPDTSRSLGAENKNTAVNQLDAAQMAMIRELAQRDREVRQHELAHKSAAGSAAGAISFDYQRGPDGRLYAVGGEVEIRLSSSSSDPAEMQRYAEQILRAALAPAEPSGQDRQVAAQARAMIAEAQALAAQESDAQADEGSEDDSQQADATSTQTTNTDSQIEREDFVDSRARTAESLAEFQQSMDEVGERIAEVNQRLVELGVFENIYQPGTLLSEST